MGKRRLGNVQARSSTTRRLELQRLVQLEPEGAASDAEPQRDALPGGYPRALSGAGGGV